MAHAISRLFDDHQRAAEAVRQLETAGVPHADISLIANNVEGRHLSEGRRDGVADGDNETAEGAATGATTGGLLGGGAGLLAGLGMLAIPGLGPVVAAGWLASTAAGAVIGAVAGGATGGLLGALKDAGHSDEDAHVYAEGVRRGGTLVSVRPSNDADAQTAERILNGVGGVDAVTRGADYRGAGWQAFDPAAQPYTGEDLARERSRFAETRSFGSDGVVNDEGAMIDSGRFDPLARPGDRPLRDI